MFVFNELSVDLSVGEGCTCSEPTSLLAVLIINCPQGTLRLIIWTTSYLLMCLSSRAETRSKGLVLSAAPVINSQQGPPSY